jgi:hypothetical protein
MPRLKWRRWVVAVMLVVVVVVVMMMTDDDDDDQDGSHKYVSPPNRASWRRCCGCT